MRDCHQHDEKSETTKNCQTQIFDHVAVEAVHNIRMEKELMLEKTKFLEALMCPETVQKKNISKLGMCNEEKDLLVTAVENTRERGESLA